MDLDLQGVFLQHLGVLAGEAAIATAEDVQEAASGRTLLEKEQPLLPASVAKLHRTGLKRPLYESIRFLDPLTVPAIRLHMEKSVGQSPSIQLLLAATGRYSLALDCVSQLFLPVPLLNLLTVMAHRLPALYEHSLNVAAISACLGLAKRHEIAEIIDLLYVGLFHDIGSLFLDPDLVDRYKTLTWSQWKQVYRHPNVSHDILKDVGGIDTPLLLAVKHHHERLDGTGYPGGLTAKDINPLGHIVAVAEMVAGASRHGTISYFRAALYASAGKLDPAVVGILETALATAGENPFADLVVSGTGIARTVEAVRDVLGHWSRLGPAAVAHPKVAKAATGVALAEQLLQRAGIAPTGNNPDLAKTRFSLDQANAIREAKFQLIQVLHHVYRHKAAYADMEPREVSHAFGRWIVDAERILVSSDDALRA